MDKSFSPYMLKPLDGEMEERVQNAALNVEESAMEGWIRGGAASREMSTEEFKNQSHKLLKIVNFVKYFLCFQMENLKL